jgi:hypothetical protein
MDTRQRACGNRNMCTWTPVNVHTDAHPNACGYTATCTWIHSHTHINTQPHARKYTATCTWIHSHMHVNTQPHARKYTATSMRINGQWSCGVTDISGPWLSSVYDTTEFWLCGVNDGAQSFTKLNSADLAVSTPRFCRFISKMKWDKFAAKIFRMWISGLEGDVWWERVRKSSETVP